MKVVSIADNWLQITAKTIEEGGLVVFPSDTVYILAVDPTNQRAVDKLLSFKNRWTGKAISVAVRDNNMAKDFVEFTDKEERIYENLLPGPFTIVSRGKHKVAGGIEAENGTLGIRIPDNKFIAKLIEKLGKPITATSANLSGRTPHYSLVSFSNTLSQKKRDLIDLAVDGGKLPKNKPSTVIDITGGEIEVLRRGDLVTGKSQSLVTKSEKETTKIGGFLIRKYLHTSPAKPLVLALSGDLGCGKTVFTRGAAKTLGVKGKITSPTFCIYNEYKIDSSTSPQNDNKGGIKKIIHMDLYRLVTDRDFEDIGFRNLWKAENLLIIEWPENMGQELWEEMKRQCQVRTIKFSYVDENTREIEWRVK